MPQLSTNGTWNMDREEFVNIHTGMDRDELGVTSRVYEHPVKEFIIKLYQQQEGVYLSFSVPPKALLLLLTFQIWAWLMRSL